jgi:hypothetical protein
LINGLKGLPIVQPDFVADSLADKLNGYLTVDVSLDECFEELTSGTFEVFGQIFFTAVEASTRGQQDLIFVGSWGEAIRELIIAYHTISLLIELVEHYKYLILCDSQIQIVHYGTV